MMASELPSTARLLEGASGALVQVDHPAGTGTIHLNGAQVTSWVPAGHGEQLWVSPMAEYGAGKSIRGGVPVCFPWFAKGPGDWEPQHGFVRRLPWRLYDVTEGQAGVTVRLGLTEADVPDGTVGLERWSQPFEVVLAATFGAELELSLTLTSTGGETLDFGGALHTYFRVSEVAEATLVGLDGVEYFDKVAGEPAYQSGDLTFSQETDNVFHSTGPVLLRDGDRRVTISSEGATRTVVWNPWEKGAAMVDDFADDGWQAMVCVEAAVVAGEDAPVVHPGSSHTMTQRVQVG